MSDTWWNCNSHTIAIIPKNTKQKQNAMEMLESCLNVRVFLFLFLMLKYCKHSLWERSSKAIDCNWIFFLYNFHSFYLSLFARELTTITCIHLLLMFSIWCNMWINAASFSHDVFSHIHKACLRTSAISLNIYETVCISSYADATVGRCFSHESWIRLVFSLFFWTNERARTGRTG